MVSDMSLVTELRNGNMVPSASAAMGDGRAVLTPDQAFLSVMPSRVPMGAMVTDTSAMLTGTNTDTKFE